MNDNSTEKCIHHWVLGKRDNDVYHAICKKCPMIKDFPAESFSMPWRGHNWFSSKGKGKNDKQEDKR